MTFEELIGKDTKKDERISDFPPYEEFMKNRGEDRPGANAARNYDFDAKSSDYGNGFTNFSGRGYGYSSHDPLNAAIKDGGDRNRTNTREEFNAPYRGASTETERPDFSRLRETPERGDDGLFRYVENDAERLSYDELSAKLSYTSASGRETFAASNEKRVQTEVPERKTEIAGRGAAVRKRAHLSTKGKLVIVSYIAVIITVATLIIVNAGNLNAGKAITPSSEVSSSQEAAF